MHGEHVRKNFELNLTNATTQIQHGCKAAYFHRRSPTKSYFQSGNSNPGLSINEGKDTVRELTESFFTDAKKEVSIGGVEGDRKVPTNPVSDCRDPVEPGNTLEDQFVMGAVIRHRH